MLKYLFLITIILQGLALLIDEFYFHHKRILPKWERIGHPLDTITIIICTGFPLLFNLNEINIKLYVGLAIFSCLFVTKDEWVHSKECNPFENWLHSILFIIHPIYLIGIWWFWSNQEFKLIQLFLLGSILFLTYQLIYWNILWKQKIK